MKRAADISHLGYMILKEPRTSAKATESTLQTLGYFIVLSQQPSGELLEPMHWTNNVNGELRVEKSETL